jgi:hypothetical protein
MLDQFLCELEQTFPEDKSFKKYHVSFNVMRVTSPRRCVDSFMNMISKYSTSIMQKDESFFDTVKDLDIKKYWTDELSDTTKDAIWQYLQTLNILGMTIVSIPADMLTMVEGAAAKCAESIQSGGQLNEKDLMSGMSNLLSNLMGQEKKLM